MRFKAGINFYAYVENNPVNLRDPSGLGTCGPGTGWLERFIPDKWWGKYDFTESCSNHDNCYATCGKSRLQCDNEFYNDMVKECKKMRGFWRLDCFSTALVYYAGVRDFGRFYFPSEKEKCCKN